MHSPASAALDPIMEEAWARKRARQRRRFTCISLVVLFGLGIAAAARERGFDGARRGSAAPSPTATPRELEFAVSLRGAHVLAAARDGGACPQGRWSNPIENRAGQRIGVARFCGLTIRKTATDRLDPSRIVSTTREIDTLTTGAIISHTTRITAFAGDGTSIGVQLQGRVIGGTGRFAGAVGTVTGVHRHDSEQDSVSMHVALR